MSKMISARIPDALYEQAQMQLHDIGATQSELIQAAFEYVIDEKSLPRSRSTKTKVKKRHLDEAAQEELREAFERIKLPLAIPSDVAYDKKVAREARMKKYGELS